MRRFSAALVGIALLSGVTANPETRVPAVSTDVVTLREVRRGSEMGVATEFGEAQDILIVERPIDAREGARSSVFVLDANGVLLRRGAVEYGRASSSRIQIVSGVSAGDRIIVSDMRGWDRFERLTLRLHQSFRNICGHVARNTSASAVSTNQSASVIHASTGRTYTGISNQTAVRSAHLCSREPL